MNAVVDGLIGGWDLTGIVTLQSGAPFSVSMSSNASLNTGHSFGLTASAMAISPAIKGH